MNVLTADEILDQVQLVGEALDVLKDRGWSAWCLESETRSVCVIGAVQVARELRGENMRNVHGELGYPYYYGDVPFAYSLLFKAAGLHYDENCADCYELQMEIKLFKYADALPNISAVYELFEEAQRFGEHLAKTAPFPSV